MAVVVQRVFEERVRHVEFYVDVQRLIERDGDVVHLEVTDRRAGCGESNVAAVPLSPTEARSLAAALDEVADAIDGGKR